MISMSYSFDYNVYRKRIHSKSGFSYTIVFIFIIILLGLAVFLQPNKVNSTKLYFVQIKSLLNYGEASKLSNELQQKNAAGYIYYDGYYHVLASYYPNIKEAEAVCENLKNDYPTANVFTLEVHKFIKTKTLTNEQNSLVEKTIKENSILINGLYDAITRFESNQINLSEFSLNLKTMKTNYDKVYSKFNQNFRNDTNIASIICDINDDIKELSSEVDNSNTQYILRYKLIKIVISHYSFLEVF